jgi:hypothetical protein
VAVGTEEGSDLALIAAQGEEIGTFFYVNYNPDLVIERSIAVFTGQLLRACLRYAHENAPRPNCTYKMKSQLPNRRWILPGLPSSRLQWAYVLVPMSSTSANFG